MHRQRFLVSALVRSFRRQGINSKYFSTAFDQKSVASSAAHFDAILDTEPSTPVSPFAHSAMAGAANPTAGNKRQRRHSFIPRIAAVQLTDNARTFFKALLQKPPRPEIIGVMLNYDQSKTSPRMVYSFAFVTANDITPQDEGVSLELVASENESHSMVPKSPAESRLDTLPKLYVHHNAFLKVLGATVDVDTSTVTPILYDRESNRMDPNA